MKTLVAGTNSATVTPFFLASACARLYLSGAPWLGRRFGNQLHTPKSMISFQIVTRIYSRFESTQICTCHAGMLPRIICICAFRLTRSGKTNQVYFYGGNRCYSRFQLIFSTGRKISTQKYHFDGTYFSNAQKKLFCKYFSNNHIFKSFLKTFPRSTHFFEIREKHRSTSIKRYLIGFSETQDFICHSSHTTVK